MMLSAVLVGIVVAVGGSVVVAAVGMLLSAVLVGIVVAVGGAVVVAAVGMLLSVVLVGIVVAVGGAAVVAMMVGVALFVLIIKHSILYTSGFYWRNHFLY
jgi:hypothetical protein